MEPLVGRSPCTRAASLAIDERRRRLAPVPLEVSFERVTYLERQPGDSTRTLIKRLFKVSVLLGPKGAPGLTRRGTVSFVHARFKLT